MATRTRTRPDGAAARAENVFRCLAALEAVLGGPDASIRAGSALGAAQQVYDGDQP